MLCLHKSALGARHKHIDLAERTSDALVDHRRLLVPLCAPQTHAVGAMAEALVTLGLSQSPGGAPFQRAG